MTYTYIQCVCCITIFSWNNNLIQRAKVSRVGTVCLHMHWKQPVSRMRLIRSGNVRLCVCYLHPDFHGYIFILADAEMLPKGQTNMSLGTKVTTTANVWTWGQVTSCVVALRPTALRGQLVNNSVVLHRNSNGKCVTTRQILLTDYYLKSTKVVHLNAWTCDCSFEVWGFFLRGGGSWMERIHKNE